MSCFFPVFSGPEHNSEESSVWRLAGSAAAAADAPRADGGSAAAAGHGGESVCVSRVMIRALLLFFCVCSAGFGNWWGNPPGDSVHSIWETTSGNQWCLQAKWVVSPFCISEPRSSLGCGHTMVWVGFLQCTRKNWRRSWKEKPVETLLNSLWLCWK